MGYQNLSKKYKINLDKNIGKVIFVVEGENTEFKLINRIFGNILQYSVLGQRRRNSNVTSLISDKNKNSVIYIVNSPESNIYSILNEKNPEKVDEYFDNIFRNITNKFKEESIDVDLFNSRKYFIFDGDRKEDLINNKEKLMNLFKVFNNSFGNDSFEMGGILLMSYPSIESAIISAFKDNTYLITDQLIDDGRIKQFCGDNKIQVGKINNKNQITGMFEELKKALNYIEKSEVDLDDFENDNKDILNFEESKNYNFLLSLFCICLIDLGIIEFED